MKSLCRIAVLLVTTVCVVSAQQPTLRDDLVDHLAGFHTTFSYDKAKDTWELRMDSEQQGSWKAFAHTKLTRK